MNMGRLAFSLSLYALVAATAEMGLFACPNLLSASQAWAQSSGSSAVTNVRPNVKTKPVPLNWRSIVWPSLDYSRVPVSGGGGLYTLPGSSGKKLRIDLLFETGVYSLPRGKRPTVGAAVDLFLQGGIGTRNFEELQQYLLENGISVSTRLSAVGYFIVTVESLTEDFPVALNVVRDLVLRPRFDRDALDLWKQERGDDFQSLLDASNSRKQNRFLEQEAMRLAFGPEHYFAQSLQRASKKSIDAISNSDVRQVARSLINRTGLNAVLSGAFSASQRDALQKLLVQIPRTEPATYRWLPERSRKETGNKLRVAIIQKNDMSQAALSLRYYFPSIGKLNRLERTRFSILREVFSASGGVVGNDRFSKAMRGDSGISYSPYASFDPDALDPNTNMALWRMNFQAPNERLAESILLARKTWTEFATQGITPEELENARTSRMNTTLATENTIFDKADEFIDDLTARTLPNSIALEMSLVRLEQERSVADVNNTLLQITSAGTVPVLVIMGNPTPEMIADIRKIPDVQVDKIVKFADLAAELN